MLGDNNSVSVIVYIIEAINSHFWTNPKNVTVLVKKLASATVSK